MGTFRIRLQLIDTILPGFSATPVADIWYGTSLADNSFLTSQNGILDVLSTPYPHPTGNGIVIYGSTGAGNSSLHFHTLGSSIFLDGDTTALEFNGLPAGFVALTALIKCVVNVLGAPSATLFLQKDIATEDAGTTIVTGLNTVTFPYVFSAGLPTMLNIVSNGCGLRLNTTGAFGNAEFSELDITGTYEIQLFQFQLENDSPVNVGDTVTITSSDASDALDLDQITSIIVQFTTAAGVFTTSAVPSFTVNGFTLIFPMINFGTSVQVTIYASGTQFSGSVPLGSLYTINFTNGSGIYRIVSDKTNDTLYANGTSQLVNAKIPNPLAKTAFFP